MHRFILCQGFKDCADCFAWAAGLILGRVDERCFGGSELWIIWIGVRAVL